MAASFTIPPGAKRMVGYGPYADMLSMRFDRACRRLGFAPPPHRAARHRRCSARRRGKADQLALF